MKPASPTFELNEDYVAESGCVIGTVNLDATDSSTGCFRLVFKHARWSIYGDMRISLERNNPSNYKPWIEIDYIYREEGSLMKGINLHWSTRTSDCVDFLWISFHLEITPDGMQLTKTGLPTTFDAGGLGNATLDVLLLQQEMVLNNFNIVVIKNLVKQKRRKDNDTTDV